MKFCRESLLAHRAGTNLPDDRWRIHFLGQPVCRNAFTKLAGIGVSMLQEARAHALQGRVSWPSPMERGVHGLQSSHHQPPAYLGARQWLERYADTHAEWSPKEAKAYSPAGRKVFYYFHYRMDLMARHGMSEDDMAKLRAEHVAISHRGKRKRDEAPKPIQDARADALASGPARDAPVARLACFLAAWRTKCP